MQGLHIYAGPAEGRDGRAVFYSRRADGPLYRWLYAPESGRWCCARVHLPEQTRKVLTVTAWRNVPVALRAELIEHYLE